VRRIKIMITGKKIYLACPYTHPDPIVMQQRFEQVNKVAARLMSEGYIVFSPISHSHPIALAGELTQDLDFWMAQNRAFIEWCDELYVAMIPGYRESKGVWRELQIAAELGKPVAYIHP
jgi:nucleoside 2-deoxyribosyltransferase